MNDDYLITETGNAGGTIGTFSPVQITTTFTPIGESAGKIAVTITEGVASVRLGYNPLNEAWSATAGLGRAAEFVSGGSLTVYAGVGLSDVGIIVEGTALIRFGPFWSGPNVTQSGVVSSVGGAASYVILSWDEFNNLGDILDISFDLSDFPVTYEEWYEGVWGFEPDSCFPAHTPITLADGTTKPIADIRIGDEVLSFKPDGSLVAGKVDKLFRNTTQEFVRLTFDDGRDGLVATLGHKFLTETGDFMEIGHMVRLGGGSVRLVEKDGSIVTARGEVLAYSAETAHLFEEAQAKATIFEGNLAVKHEVESGWATYNFIRLTA